MDLNNYYLDLESVFKLSEKQSTYIQDSYRDMLIYNNEPGREDIAKSLFNTLNENGYLVNIRDEKIEKILE